MKINQDTRIRAGEVNAVEWENRVRKDLGLSERKKYGGLSVYGKSIIESSKYSGFYSLQNNSNYGNNDFSIPLKSLHRTIATFCVITGKTVIQAWMAVFSISAKNGTIGTRTIGTISVFNMLWLLHICDNILLNIAVR